MTDPHHPDYGLPSTLRFAVLAALDHVTVREAAEIFNVSPSSIYRWKSRIR